MPKLKPEVYRAIIDEAHKNGMETLAHLSRTSALADAKDLLKSGVDGFVHTVRDRDVDDEYIALVKAHPKVWTGPNIPGPGETEEEINALAETLPASTIANMRRQLDARKQPGNPPNALFELHCRNVKKIHDAGMIIGLGTDGTGDGFGAHQQIAYYVALRVHDSRSDSGGDIGERQDSRTHANGRGGRRQRSRLRRAGRQSSGKHRQHAQDQ